MILRINGEAREMPDGLTLSGLVEHLDMKADRLAIELNRDIVAHAKWPETRLKDGDQLEIVHFVGGG
jgi:thiamine biosynthesis protein ThiS